MRNIMIFILLTRCLFISAQQQEDTITQWKARFATLGGIPKISCDGTWIGINKQYKLGGDSAYVVNTKDKKVYKILSTGGLDFLKEEGVFGRKADQMQFLNLKTGKINQYNNIRNFYRLDNLNRYWIYSKDKSLRLYDLTGKQIFGISDIDDPLVTDSKSKLYALKKNEGRSEVLVITGTKQETIYSTVHQIRKMELTPSGKQIVIIEIQSHKASNQLTILDTEHDFKKIVQLEVPNKSEVNLTEIQNGEYYLISARVRFTEEESPLVEVWYGNDPFVNEHNKIYVNNEYWLWDTNKNKVLSINLSENNELASLNNARYFLCYIPRKGYNFSTFIPDINDAEILDVTNGKSVKVGNLKQVPNLKKGWQPGFLGNRVFYSKDGRWFLASNDGKSWTLFNSSGQREALIEQYGLEKPVFSANSNQIYFESSNDLWQYDITAKKLTTLGIAKGKAVQIKNKISEWGGNGLGSYLPDDSILLEVFDNYTNTISYKLNRRGKWKQVVPETNNRIDPDHLLYNEEMTSFYTLERNFNLPSALYSHDSKGRKSVLFDSAIKDAGAKRIKQEIYNFRAVGKNLRGILYYPLNYHEKKKYPMVVHIYQVQRTLSNDYLSPNNNSPIGFQIRTLLERGYFVYLPDIVYNESGTGLSALDCVNQALDALNKHPNINKQRIGLIGHSHGGYETNFIATHSNRFATYISGAGNSDIIRSYFSYNYNFTSPFYWQYETEQYEMNKPFAEDKERYLQNSPILNVEKVNAPILLWAGKQDKNIAWDQVMEFYIGLRRYNKQVIALFYPKGNHDFLHFPQEEKDRDRRILEWFDYFLKDKTDVLWINKQIKKDTP